MHRFDPQMTDLMLAYVRDRLSLVETPVDGLGDRRDLERAVAGLIGEGPRDATEVLGVYVDHLADTILSADSPRFYAFIPAAPTKAALLFDMLVSAASLQGCSWLEAAGAVVAENQALRVLADIAGLPPAAGGVFVSGGSAGNLSALVVARDVARHRRIEAGLPEVRHRVVVSDQAHSSIANSLSITMMSALVIPTLDTDGVLTGAAIRRSLADDADPTDICAVVATTGTTNAGIIDDVASVGDVARDLGWWLHVDGAYGGAGILSERVRERFAGIEQADSVVMDPHKWWFAPFDAAALLYREPHLAAAVHAQDASYLDVIHGQDINPSDLAHHLTRRARGLPLWFSLAVNGISAYRDAVDRGIELADYAARRLAERPDCDLIRDPDLSIVLFRRRGWGAHEYALWSRDLLQTQRAFVTSSRWRGEVVGRLVFLHPATTEAMIDEAIDALG